MTNEGLRRFAERSFTLIGYAFVIIATLTSLYILLDLMSADRPTHEWEDFFVVAGLALAGSIMLFLGHAFFRVMRRII